MLDPSQVDVTTLPSVALSERGLLPNSAGIYFAIADLTQSKVINE